MTSATPGTSKTAVEAQLRPLTDTAAPLEALFDMRDLLKTNG